MNIPFYTGPLLIKAKDTISLCFISEDGYDMNNIAYKWEIDSEDGMSFVPSDMKMLPQFKLTKLQLSSLYTTYVIGEYLWYHQL